MESPTMQMTPTTVLDLASKILEDRGLQYGPADKCFKNIAQIASAILGREITPREVAIILVSTKLARMNESPQLADSYIDAINYLAFAAGFAKATMPTQGANLEDDIAALAKRFAPVKTENAYEKDDRGDCPVQRAVYPDSDEGVLKRARLTSSEKIFTIGPRAKEPQKRQTGHGPGP